MGFDTEKIRSTNSLFDWLIRYGIEIDRKGFSKCPFHDEKTASFRVYKDGTYHCFGCGAHGDVITFVMNMQNLSFTETCEMLDRDITYSELRKIDSAKRKRNTQEDMRRKAIVNYWKIFDDWKINEDFINAFKPSGPSEAPNSLFLSALSRRSILEHKLNLAEMAYRMRGVQKWTV